ncbi:hypothetical protein Tco_0747782 [Tanacetum coccineum]|uniref:Uncharacterized protein n=1 Tax=Tanacetum coccineum TaxID=301880 RepID=A0ABQ4YW89_9ASTR
MLQPQVPIISNPEPCNNQTIDELPQTLPSFDLTCYSGDGNSFSYDSTSNSVNDSPNVFNPPPQPQYVPYSCELCRNDAHHGYDCPLKEVEDFHTEDGEIEDDILREKLSKINLLIAKIEAINSNPPPSLDFVTKSSSTSLNFFLEETNTFDNSIPESETFCFDLEEISSGSSNILVRIILFRIISFYFDDDQIEEKE